MFGERLKQLRIEKGLYQKDLAKILGVSAGAIGMYENNKRTPDFELLIKIAKFFDVSIDYLLCQTDIRKPIAKRIYTPEELIDILPEEYRELFKKQNFKYVKFVKEMMKEEINPDDLIELIKVAQKIRKEYKKEQENNS